MMIQMTPDELRYIIGELETTQVDLAAAIGLDARTIRKYLAGDREIPNPVALLLRILTTKKNWAKEAKHAQERPAA